MKSLIVLFGLICVVICGVFMVGGFAKGFMSVSNLLPGWAWTILFLGCVIFYTSRDNKAQKEAKDAFRKRFDKNKE